MTFEKENRRHHPDRLAVKAGLDTWSAFGGEFLVDRAFADQAGESRERIHLIGAGLFTPTGLSY